MTAKQTTLPCGLTVVTDHMPHLKTSALGVWVNAGSRLESAAENGLTHLFEHMAFKGTTSRNALQIAEEIEAVGGEMNASTSVEHTNYYVRVLAEDVPLGLDILADILQNSLFDEAELEREKHVILQEIGAATDSPEDQAFDLLLATAWPDQALGRPILGTPETVNSFTPQTIRDFMARRYSPGNMVLAAAGAVDHQALCKLAQEAFTSLPQGSACTADAVVYKGGYAQVERDLQEVQLILGFEGLSYHDDDYYPAQLLASILGGGMSSRLFQEVREKRGLCYSVYAFHWAFLEGGLFAVHAATGPDDTEQLLPVIVDELNSTIDTLRPEELARAKAQTKASLMIALESPAARAGQIARQMMIYNRIVPVDELIEKLEKVTLEDIRRTATKLFTGSAPTLVRVGPRSAMMDIKDIQEKLQARISGVASRPTTDA
ncbi:M16 family metallopeptidase [Polycladidibacter hongkongensis]|uniref:M16 family metallopeptidase n=1 Tax=Polycladidibacter hongkongensis TaxID=1647556 RepID=UPI00082AE835|nr:pitrilysin family protein [Pseudovibrio hongkongensis]